MDLSVIIPAYNEEETISQTIDEVRKCLQGGFESYEIVVVDDNSKDSTLDILKKTDDIILIRNIRNHGKGYSIKKGLKYSKGDWLLFMDADNSTPIATEFEKLYKYISDNDLVVASRALPDSDVQIRQGMFKIFLGKAGNLLIRIILGTKIKDTQCGFKLFNAPVKELFRKITIDDWGFDFELIYLAKKYKMDIKEVPVVWRNRMDSRVKWYNYLITLWQVFKVRLNDFRGKYN